MKTSAIAWIFAAVMTVWIGSLAIYLHHPQPNTIALAPPIERHYDPPRRPEPARWYAANQQHSDCIEISFTPGQYIAHQQDENYTVTVNDVGAALDVSTSDGGTMHFFHDHDSCYAARIASRVALANRYR